MSSTMAATTKTKQLTLKLLVNKESNKVLFAEAEKDFVDILCSFLTLPLGTIARLVEKDSDIGPVTVGSLNSLYHSVENLDKENLLMDTCKEMLLQPKNSSEDYISTLELNIDDTQPTMYFLCSSLVHCDYPWVSTSPSNSCPQCYSPLTRSVFLKHFSKGFVSSVATFLITDELIVMPNTMDNINLDMIQYFAIKGTSSVEEITVNVTKEKVLDLLKCALLSKSTLTDLFIGQKPSLEKSRFSSYDFENTANIQFNLKLFMRKPDGKILFALGQENFANLILSFLTFPLGGVVSKLGGKCSFGSIDGLHKSIADLDEETYFISKEAKSKLFGPPLAPQAKSTTFCTQLLPFRRPVKPLYCHYQRGNYRDSVIHDEFFINHHEYMLTNCREIRWIDPKSSSQEAYVKGPRTYVVSDDLVIAPASPISALDFINRFGTPLIDMQEKVVTIGSKECLCILKTSLTSTSALTNGLCHLLAEVKDEK